MTDGAFPTGPDFDGHVSPPAPLPLPSESPGPWRRWRSTAIIGGIALVLLTLGACCWVASGPFGSLPFLNPSSAENTAAALSDLSPDSSLWWCDNGRYAVVQTIEGTDQGTFAAVVVYDVKAGTTRTLHKTRVVAVEPRAPRLWIVPETGTLDTESGPDAAQVATRPLDIAGDGVDRAAADLEVWALDQPGIVTAPAGSMWAAWPAPKKGRSALLTVDAAKGSLPSGMLFGDVAAAVPGDAGTFEPVGWSPSGRYFAVVTQVGAAVADRSLKAYVDAWNRANGVGFDTSDVTPAGPETPVAPGRVLVFDARDGSLAASVRIDEPFFSCTGGSALASWEGTSDALLSLDSGATPRLLRTALTEGEPAATTEVGSSSPEWVDASRGRSFFAGTSSSGPVACRSTNTFADVWRQGPADTAEHLGTVGPLANASGDGIVPGDGSAARPVRWAEGVGLLWVRDTSDDGSDDFGSSQLVLTDLHGGARKVLTELPDEAPDLSEPGD